jgi:DNA-binding MarR family transcriptional regulator
MTPRRAPSGTTSDARRVDYGTLADLRYRVRRFLRMREIAARRVGIEPQQYLMLLQIKGLEGRQAATIGVLAERLQIGHHAAVQLADRLADRRLVERRRDRGDRRQVVLCLRPSGERVLSRLASYSVAELTSEGPQLLASLRRLLGPSLRSEGGRRRGLRRPSR